MLLLFKYTFSFTRDHGRIFRTHLNAVHGYETYPRVYSIETLDEGKELLCDAEMQHYLTTVLRKKDGAYVRLFNERHGEYLCTLSLKASKSSRRAESASVTLHEQLRLPPPLPRPTLTLFFGIIKRQRLKVLLEKASEVGVDLLVPVITEFAQLQDSKGILSSGTANKHLTESAEQCERLRVAELGDTVALAELCSQWQPSSDGSLLVCRERCPEAPPILTAAAALGATSLPARVSILIGPEGGFSPSELAMLASHDFVKFVSLGENVLRSETAGIVALAAMSLMLRS